MTAAAAHAWLVEVGVSVMRVARRDNALARLVDVAAAARDVARRDSVPAGIEVGS